SSGSKPSIRTNSFPSPCLEASPPELNLSSCLPGLVPSAQLQHPGSQRSVCSVQASEELLKEHYSALRDRPFYGRLVKYMSSGPIVAMVWQGLDVVKTVRSMIGETNPAESRPGTIRGDFCVEVGKHSCAKPARNESAFPEQKFSLLCSDQS
uniref:nucleoside-diphosphate kinase n=1 Tax=Zonotrichia albicollis TaxID=44394 RepID=A0A8D2QA42_ZONAL